MINEALKKACEYERKKEQEISSQERPVFHLSPRVGWMNDPNGFSYYDGKYHLFFQYHPYDTVWGPMHWGHAVSDDLLHWEYLPVAIAPDEKYDKDGCFSGSALALDDGRHLLMYTGVRREEQPDGTVRDIQAQCIAVGDGLEYKKYEKNPVLGENDLPEGSSKFDFRDPKMWRGTDGRFYCVVGNRHVKNQGQILLFSSDDGFDWKYDTTLASNDNRYGRMWECPDFFKLGDKWLLITSPQDLVPQGLEFDNGNVTLCIAGEYNAQNEKFTEQNVQTLDYGIDFYAPQTILAPDGRRIMIGWMQNWDTCQMCPEDAKWFGQTSLPRELFWKDGRVCQKPVREVDAMRSECIRFSNVTVSGDFKLDEICGRMIDMEISLRPNDVNNHYRKFRIDFAENDQYYTSLIFDPIEDTLEIDRKHCGSRRAIDHQRKCRANYKNNELKLRIILDRYSAEIFVNDGESVITTTMYTDQNADSVSFYADGKAQMDIVKYNLD